MTTISTTVATVRDTATVRLGGMSPALPATTDAGKVRLGGMSRSL